MTASSTDTRSSIDSCPSLEEIAAFLDHTLSSKDGERITTHLASCESCYEVYAGAVHFQQEEGASVDTRRGGVVRFPFAGKTSTGSHRRASSWLAMAASFLLVPILGFLAWRAFQASQRMVVADLVAPLNAQEISKSDLFAYTRLRGDGAKDPVVQKASFLSGAILVDLQMSLTRDDAETSFELLDLLGSKLAEVSFMEDTAKAIKQDADRLEESPSYLIEVAQRASNLEASLDSSFLLPESLAFGKWAEAGRLAALTQSPSFFEDRNNRRFLDYLFKQTPWAGDDLLEDVPNHLQAIQETWNAGELDSDDYTELATHFQSIIEAYDTPDDY